MKEEFDIKQIIKDGLDKDEELFLYYKAYLDEKDEKKKMLILKRLEELLKDYA